MSILSIHGRKYGAGSPLIVAEVGTGHNGDRVKAAELIAAAVDSGAGCVKFQHVYADEIIHPLTGVVPLPGGPVALYDRFRALEIGLDFLSFLKDETESRGALFLCTPFGKRSARELRDLGVAAMKVASPELNHEPLLDELASFGLPVILSSGVSTLADIERAVGLFSARPAYQDGVSLALLHCVTAYPAPERDYNLRILPVLSTLLSMAPEVSDHSMDPVLVPALAAAVGAVVIEKHLCLSRDDPGLDDPIALPPGQFAAMVRAVQDAAGRPLDETALTLSRDYTPELVEAVLGNGRKRLASSEADNYGRTNRSLHARTAIRAGQAFTEGNVAILRTEKVLRPGVQPRFLPIILGRLAARDVPDGQGIRWEDVGGPVDAQAVSPG